MLYYALLFLMVGSISHSLHFLEVTTVGGQIARVLFFIGMLLLLLHLISRRSRRHT